MKTRIFLVAVTALGLVCTATAQLDITVMPPRIISQKAIVQLALKNNFAEPIDSARAVMFVVDKDGKVVSQTPRWIIGGETNRPALAAGATNSFHFVIPTTGKPFTTNRFAVTYIKLANGKTANPVTDVQVRLGLKP